MTGHTGFKGSWLSLWLSRLGARVTGVALDPPTRPALFDEAGAADFLEDVRSDITTLSSLVAVTQAARPELVIHMAAQPLVRRSYAAAVETFAVNLMGSVHVYEAARQTESVKALVHVSTDKCYENFGRGAACREDDPLGGHDPYSASKAAAEIAFSSFQRSFFQPDGRMLAASGRAGNVIGGGDWSEDRIVPDCVRALARGEAIPVRNPESTRPWQHVLEALSGYLTLAGRLLAGDRSAVGAWNFGPDSESVKTVEDLVTAVIREWGEGRWVHTREPAAAHEAPLLGLDCRKAREQLGWRPVWGFEETVRRTSAWYKALRDGVPARDLCFSDIADYMRQSGGEAA